MRQRTPGFLALPLACLCLSGCLGALLGGGKPAQLYRFGADIAAPSTDVTAATPPTAAVPTVVILSPVQFSQPLWDRMVASRGAQTFYIKDARWVAPAPELFEQALRNAFRQRANGIALVRPEDAVAASQSLHINVERFEAAYTSTAVEPTIMIRVRVMVIDTKTHKVANSAFVEETQPAAANRIDAIVAAFDAAASRSAFKIADWTSGAATAQKTSASQP